MDRASLSTRVSTRGWLVWGVGVGAYVVAVIQRTSLGVAGLDTAERFGASAGVLASFAVLQLLVYASLQIPVGRRGGPRSARAAWWPPARSSWRPAR